MSLAEELLADLGRPFKKHFKNQELQRQSQEFYGSLLAVFLSV
jgi:hypothetical protein